VFAGLSLVWNLLLFALAAGAIGWAGTRLERLTSVIARAGHAGRMGAVYGIS
jgi:hypothetical protein